MEEDIQVYPPEGIDNFCQLFWRWLRTKMSEENMSADAVAKTTGVMSSSSLSRLKRHINGTSRAAKFDLETFFKLEGHISTTFVVDGLPWKPRGEFYNAQELMAIALDLDAVGYPIDRTEKPYSGPNSEAVQWIKKNIGRQPLHVISDRAGASLFRLEALLNGESPILDDLTWMSRAFPQGYRDLVKLYGIDLEAKAQQIEPQYKEAIAMITAAMDGAAVEDFPEIKNELYDCLAGNRIHPTKISNIVAELGMELSAIYDLRVAYGYPGEAENTLKKTKSKTNQKRNGSKV